MSEPIWNKFLTERDKAVFEASGYGARGGFGKRPALLVIDVNYAFCGDKPEPILESIKRWRNSCGEDAWIALPYIKLADRQVPRQGRAGDLHHRRAPRRQLGHRQLDAGRTIAPTRTSGKPATNVDGNEIVAEIAPRPQDIVVYKQKPSGFFGTNMASYLTLLGCDSLIVTGTTTSGCVRATVLDAFSLNYRVAIAEEGCFDRSQASHAINLCDMNAKYADVVKTSEVLAFLDALPSGMFDLPKGAPAAPRTAQARGEFLNRHCEPEAKQSRTDRNGLLSSLTLLAMTATRYETAKSALSPAAGRAAPAPPARNWRTAPAPAGSRCARRGSGARTDCSSKIAVAPAA